MLRLDDATLVELSRRGESARVERKESLRGDAPEKIREAVCAFANDLSGSGQLGVVLVGQRDDGSPSGLAITDELLRALADMKTDGNLTPPPSLDVEKRSIAGAEVAVVTVLPSDAPPVRLRGRIWVRTGPRRGLATAQDERILNERRRHLDRPWDIRAIASSRLEDLDVRRFETEYLPALVAPDVIAANDRSLVEKLAATKLVATADEPTPTGLGLLVVGRAPTSFIPGAYVQFLRIEGTALGDPIADASRFDGPLAQVVTRLEEKLEAHNRTRVVYADRPIEHRRSLYAAEAVRQLVRNAILHRTYEHTHAPVRVNWFDDRIEILNPGGPYGQVTVARFGEPGLTDYRNPNLAEAARALGLVQRFGSGLGIANRALAANGNPAPEFQVTPENIRCTLRPAPWNEGNSA